MMKSLLYRLLLGAAAMPALSLPALATEAAPVWRVCIPDLVVPPFLVREAQRPGLIERLVLDSARHAGLDVRLLYAPVRRCRVLLEQQAVDALIVAPVPSNLGLLRFPMKEGAVDADLRLARLRMVWVKRADSSFEWAESGANQSPAELLVGIRAASPDAADLLKSLDFRIDEIAVDIPQVLRKLSAQRVDLAVGLHEEVLAALREHEGPPLLILSQALTSRDYYGAVRQNLSPALQARVESWWHWIGLLRNSKGYAAMDTNE